MSKKSNKHPYVIKSYNFLFNKIKLLKNCQNHMANFLLNTPEKKKYPKNEKFILWVWIYSNFTIYIFWRWIALARDFFMLPYVCIFVEWLKCHYLCKHYTYTIYLFIFFLYVYRLIFIEKKGEVNIGICGCWIIKHISHIFFCVSGIRWS
jgi:hypothetical protein